MLRSAGGICGCLPCHPWSGSGLAVPGRWGNTGWGWPSRGGSGGWLARPVDGSEGRSRHASVAVSALIRWVMFRRMDVDSSNAVFVGAGEPRTRPRPRPRRRDLPRQRRYRSNQAARPHRRVSHLRPRDRTRPGGRSGLRPRHPVARLTHPTDGVPARNASNSSDTADSERAIGEISFVECRWVASIASTTAAPPGSTTGSGSMISPAATRVRVLASTLTRDCGQRAGGRGRVARVTPPLPRRRAAPTRAAPVPEHVPRLRVGR